jgi:hypothetical protein
LAWSSRISGRIRSDQAGFPSVSDHGQILARFCRNLVGRHPATVAGCRRIPVPPGFGQPTIAGFGQSDIKCACNDKEYNFGKRFMVFKTINRFPKIKEAFTVKPKMVFVDQYFRPYQTP